MKFVPLAAFEQLNALMCGVEAQNQLLTVRVEAFSTRKSKEEKHLEQQLNTRHHSNSGTGSEMQSPESGANQPNAFSSGDVMVSPGHSSSDNLNGMVAGGGSFHIGSNTTGGNNNDQQQSGGGGGGNNVDDRLVFLIAALNAIHGQSDYDFSVLAESDFNICTAEEVFQEVNTAVTAVPNSPFGTDGSDFWNAIGEQLIGDGHHHHHNNNSNSNNTNNNNAGNGNSSGGAENPALDVLTSSEVEYFKFCSPECDPLAQGDNLTWSAHYFVYCKKQRLLISVLCFSEQGGGNGAGGGAGGSGTGVNLSQNSNGDEASASNTGGGGGGQGGGHNGSGFLHDGPMNYVSPNSVEAGMFPSEPDHGDRGYYNNGSGGGSGSRGGRY